MNCFRRSVLVHFLTLFLIAPFFQSVPAGKIKIRVGYFPNITHAQALIGMAGDYFSRAFGEEVEVQSFLFNAGPSCMEALLAGRLDLAYVGPNPAVNTYLRSNGKALRILAGGCAGGSALVLHKDTPVFSPEGLRGKKLATPQLGNTQDVALRFFLAQNGLAPREQGGDVLVYPVGNSNSLLLFRRREIDGVWTVEPWVSRLVIEEGGYIFLDEKELWPDGLYPTTYLVGTVDFLEKHPDLTGKWVEVHFRLTQELAADPESFIPEINRELSKWLGQPLPVEVLENALRRLQFTCEPMISPFLVMAEKAYYLGYLNKDPSTLRGIFVLSFLERTSGADYSKIL